MKIEKEEAATGIVSKDNDYVSVGQQIELEEEERHPVGIQKYAGDEFVDGSTEGTITPNNGDLKVQLAEI